MKGTTLKVKFLISREGPGASYLAGNVYDLPEAEAKLLLDAGKVVPVKEENRTATQPDPPERRKRTPRKKD